MLIVFLEEYSIILSHFNKFEEIGESKNFGGFSKLVRKIWGDFGWGGGGMGCVGGLKSEREEAVS